MLRRRRFSPEPFAATATASRASAGFGAALAVIAVFMGRSGMDPRGALAVLASALAFATLAAVLAVWSATVVWRTGRRGSARAIVGLVLAGLTLAYPAYLAVRTARMPVAADVSTDPASPPTFSASAARAGALHEEPSAELRDATRRAYPALQPVLLDLSEEDAYALALKVFQAHGWRILEAAPPAGKFGVGRIDVVARTRVMGLPDDVALRIRPVAGQTRVDIRSASRFGRFDDGENAARIQSLSDELLDAAS